MRRGMDPSVVSEGARLVGVSLGADFTSEHEWGIARLKGDFGITDDPMVFGLARRQITRIPDGWEYGRHGGTYLLGYAPPHQRPPHDYLKDELRLYGDSELSGAWDEGSFGAAMRTDALRPIHEAVKTKNVAIFLAGGQAAFGNAGLCIAIADRLPAEVVKAWAAHDEDTHKIRVEMNATGIEDTLKAAGRRYFALLPRRDKDGSLMFWLNPMEQDANNYGWYGLIELEAWAKGQGPIPKVKP